MRIRHSLLPILAVLALAAVAALVWQAPTPVDATPVTVVHQAEPQQIEFRCRFLCEDGHTGTLACPAGVTLEECESFLPDEPCKGHGMMLALSCFPVF